MNRLIVVALSGLLVLGACGGVERERPLIIPLHGVGDVDNSPDDIRGYHLEFTVEGIDVYTGGELTNEGHWSDWYADIVDVPVAAFGIAFDPQGWLHPWALGPLPDTSLATSRFLHGRASWHGALVGVGEDGIAVGGYADMSVNLQTLTGRLDFSYLEYASELEDLFLPGIGTTWGDGDLTYIIAVTDNTFVEIGGDAGTIHGAFFGRSHGAMGGTLERYDLTAAFGGSRRR